MGGHGGLNILPQKRWNVYNYENREKVRRDEEEAAKEELLKHEQAYFEYRLEQPKIVTSEDKKYIYRLSYGIAPMAVKLPWYPQKPNDDANGNSGSDDDHPNDEKDKKYTYRLAYRIAPVAVKFPCYLQEPNDDANGNSGLDDDHPKDEKKKKTMKKEEAKPRIVTPEDEKYRLAYGVAGIGVKLPWYLQKPNDDANGNSGSDDDHPKDEKKKSGIKTFAELREEQMKREKREKERERALRRQNRQRDREDDGVAEREASKKKMKKEEAKPKIVTPEDEKYRLACGVTGIGVKLPWYLQKPNDDAPGNSGSDDDHPKDEIKKSGIKTFSK